MATPPAGLAAAERLGAPYPFSHDPLATAQYDTYLRVAHGLPMRRRKPEGPGRSGKAEKEA